jgi:hypothetical protein
MTDAIRFTLEELDQVFSVDRRTFLKHQTTLWLPYVYKKHVLRRKDVPEPPALIATGDSADEKVDIDMARSMSRRRSHAQQ